MALPPGGRSKTLFCRKCTNAKLFLSNSFTFQILSALGIYALLASHWLESIERKRHILFLTYKDLYPLAPLFKFKGNLHAT